MRASELAEQLHELHVAGPLECAAALRDAAVAADEAEAAVLQSALQLLFEVLLAPGEARALERLLAGPAGDRLASTGVSTPELRELENRLREREEELARRLAASPDLAELEERERAVVAATQTVQQELRVLEERAATLGKESSP